MHIPGNQNLADIFTKEMKDIQHFIDVRDQLVTAPKVLPIIESRDIHAVVPISYFILFFAILGYLILHRLVGGDVSTTYVRRLNFPIRPFLIV